MGDAAPPPAGGKAQKSYFDVLGICCPSEVPLVERLLEPLPGVRKVTVIVPSRTVIVLHDADATSPAHIGNARHHALLVHSTRYNPPPAAAGARFLANSPPLAGEFLEARGGVGSVSKICII